MPGKQELHQGMSWFGLLSPASGCGGKKDTPKACLLGSKPSGKAALHETPQPPEEVEMIVMVRPPEVTVVVPPPELVPPEVPPPVGGVLPPDTWTFVGLPSG